MREWLLGDLFRLRIRANLSADMTVRHWGLHGQKSEIEEMDKGRVIYSFAG